MFETLFHHAPQFSRENVKIILKIQGVFNASRKAAKAGRAEKA